MGHCKSCGELLIDRRSAIKLHQLHFPYCTIPKALISRPTNYNNLYCKYDEASH